jgi:hypothetical protein
MRTTARRSQGAGPGISKGMFSLLRWWPRRSDYIGCLTNAEIDRLLGGGRD